MGGRYSESDLCQGRGQRRQRKTTSADGTATTVVELETQSAAGNPNYLAVEQTSRLCSGVGKLHRNKLRWVFSAKPMSLARNTGFVSNTNSETARAPMWTIRASGRQNW